MRLPLIAPDQLSDQQRPLYDDMKAGIAKGFRGFASQRKDGALLGPWNPWLREPRCCPKPPSCPTPAARSPSW